MSWLDQFFDGVGQAPIVVTVGPVPKIGITAATSSAAGSMSAADKAKLDGLGVQVPAPVTSPAVAGSGTTPVTLLTFAIPTGYDAIVTFNILGKITGGAGAGGHTGQRVGGAVTQLFVNPTGTPTISTGTLSPGDGIYWSVDETSNFVSPDFSAVYAANSVTLQVASTVANVNFDWTVVVTSISLHQE